MYPYLQSASERSKRSSNRCLLEDVPDRSILQSSRNDDEHDYRCVPKVAPRKIKRNWYEDYVRVPNVGSLRLALKINIACLKSSHWRHGRESMGHCCQKFIVFLRSLCRRRRKNSDDCMLLCACLPKIASSEMRKRTDKKPYCKISLCT